MIVNHLKLRPLHDVDYAHEYSGDSVLIGQLSDSVQDSLVSSVTELNSESVTELLWLLLIRRCQVHYPCCYFCRS